MTRSNDARCVSVGRQPSKRSSYDLLLLHEGNLYSIDAAFPDHSYSNETELAQAARHAASAQALSKQATQTEGAA